MCLLKKPQIRPQPAYRKLWIDLDGVQIPVSDSHEEWANQYGVELEALLALGWVCVQSVPPPYLYLQFCLRLNALQAATVRVLLQNRFEQIVVEFEGVTRSFVDGGEEMEYVMHS